MKIDSASVSTEKQVIGSATFPVFETLTEALEHPEHGLGEAKLLELVNAQVRTNAMNTFRQTRAKGPTKTLLRQMAIDEILAEVAAGNHAEVVGNPAAVNNLVERRMGEIEQRMKENLTSDDSNEESDDSDES